MGSAAPRSRGQVDRAADERRHLGDHQDDDDRVAARELRADEVGHAVTGGRPEGEGDARARPGQSRKGSAREPHSASAGRSAANRTGSAALRPRARSGQHLPLPIGGHPHRPHGVARCRHPAPRSQGWPPSTTATDARRRARHRRKRGWSEAHVQPPVLARGLRRDATRGPALGAAAARGHDPLGPERRALPGPADARPPRVDGHGLDPSNEWGHDVLWWLDRMVRSRRPLAGEADPLLARPLRHRRTRTRR